MTTPFEQKKEEIITKGRDAKSKEELLGTAMEGAFDILFMALSGDKSTQEALNDKSAQNGGPKLNFGQ